MICPLVEEQLREIREDLPRGYYYELPKLAGGPLEGYPRIYALALALIAHTDSRLETETLRRFVGAYQRVAPLTIGELWAVAITLRLALVENLTRLATRIIVAREGAKRRTRSPTSCSKRRATARALLPLVTDRFGKREKLDRSLVVGLTSACATRPAVMPGRWLDVATGARGRVSNRSCTSSTTAGRRADHGRQHHHQHASALDARLARLL